MTEPKISDSIRAAALNEQIVEAAHAAPPRVRPEFKYHELNEAGIDACNQIRAGFTTLLDLVETTIGPGHERALVVTKLQEACNWAVRGAALQTNHQAAP